MNDDDLNKFRGIVKEELNLALLKIDQRFEEMEQRFDQKLVASERRVMGEIGQYIEDYLFPMIEEKADKTDIDRLEHKLDLVIDQLGTHLNHSSAC